MHVRDYKCVCDGKRGSQTEASNITSAWQKNYHLAAGYNTSGGPCIPCPSDCHVVMCLDGEDCASTGHLLPDAGLRLPLLVITSLTILGVVSLLALTCKYKKHKVGHGNVRLGRVLGAYRNTELSPGKPLGLLVILFIRKCHKTPSTISKHPFT